MVVSRVGARLEYDCADGTIDQPIILDAKGRFTAKGSYTPERGGPRRNGRAVAAPAGYVGQVTAGTMTLILTLEKGKQQAGVFTLTRDHDSLLTKCR